MTEISTPALLEARGLAFARRDIPVFGPLDCCVDAGEVVRVEGSNGAGKTTLLRILAGLLRPGSGSVSLHGGPLSRENAAGEILLLGHRLGLKDDLSARENLQTAARLYGRRRGAEADATLDAVGLGGYADEAVCRLSAGQKKRVALARLWLLPASLWLLDEPRVNLDAGGVAVVDRLIERHVHRGGAVLETDHGGTKRPHTGRSIQLSGEKLA